MWKKTSVVQLLKWLFCFAILFLGSRGAVVKYKWLWLSCMLVHNASETTLGNVKRFRNPGATLKLMVATLWEASSFLVPKSTQKKVIEEGKPFIGYMKSPCLLHWWFLHFFFLCDILKWYFYKRNKLFLKKNNRVCWNFKSSLYFYLQFIFILWMDYLFFLS